jgi:outer membrane receptor protein involved in Fe transport
VQAGLVYQGKARAALGTAEQQVTGNLPGYTLVDLFAGYEWSRYSVELFATNIFDERNQLSRFFVCGSNCETNEFLHIVPGRPRTIGLRLGTRF